MNWFNPKKPPLHSILFVCTANVTRSPTAETLFRYYMAKVGEDWKIASAGVKAIKKVGPNPVVAFIMHQRKIPMTQHRSQPVTKKLLNRHYWIIVMETTHKEAILKVNTNLKERVFTLREFGLSSPPPEPDMPDPTGKDPDDYRELFEILDREIPRLVKQFQIKISDMNMLDVDD